MKEASPRTIYLKDYTPPAFDVEHIDLCFRLFEDGAEVVSELRLKRCDGGNGPLVLDGEELELRELSIDGRILASAEYSVDDESLTIPVVPEHFVLRCVTWINPQDNKRLEGLYKSSTMFCTQCEAEGFRRITYYLDRPDVMSVFRTRIEADKSLYPVLLSNGNPVEQGDLDGGRHFVTWEDPFRKPCYLFALVAGDLYVQEDSFMRASGNPVALKIYVDHKNSDKCDYALDALKRSMRWDEEVYGREYDLDIFMIVAVDDFNMGAMENKGLNIFNSSCVLAKPDATTDAAYQRIEAIVAHEYFHNWSGNRVTCRDWFQLSLKEGFTVYRDSQFSADMNSAGVKRIDDVNLLRTAQFAEDAGPMSHPVRPSSFMEISNFYTLTVYEKGAEVVRMYHTLLGDELFRQGCDVYFERFDGQAVTTDDFAACMAEVSGRDLCQFKRWYEQGGTPRVQVTSNYDAEKQQYILNFQQSCPPTPGQDQKQPFHIPIELGLLDAETGQPLPLEQASGATTWVYELKDAIESLVFNGIAREPVPSLLRGFSAPVKLSYDYSDEQLVFLMRHDEDSFNRWDAGQRLALRVIQNLVSDALSGKELVVPEFFVETYRSVLKNASIDKAMLSKLLMLPAESYLIELADCADVDAIHAARKVVRKALAESMKEDLLAAYRENHLETDTVDLGFDAMSARALKNMLLALLMGAQDKTDALALAQKQFESAANMTDEIGALSAIVSSGDRAAGQAALDRFYKKWKDDAQVVELWFSVQSANSEFADLSHIKALMQHEAFQITNPNKVRSVIGAFCNQNLQGFHQQDGSGYEFLADRVIELDGMNPQIASRLLSPLTRWRKFDESRQSMMQAQLKRIFAQGNLSKDVREVVEKSLP